METRLPSATKDVIMSDSWPNVIAMAVASGVTCLIAVVAKGRPTALAASLSMGRDEHAKHYIEAYRQRERRQVCEE